MICNPSETDLLQIKEIWKSCFGDDDETVDFYFENCFCYEDCYVNKTDGNVHAVLQMIPCEIVDGENKYFSKYMYAVCTHPSFQGRGLMSELINESINREFAKGVKAILCVPSTKRLFDFYYRFGFTEGIYSSSYFYDRESLGNLSSKCDYRKNLNINELNA